jgi:4-hydroxybenzoate polyprenyltransferase
MYRINVQILIIIWWIGAVAAASSLFIPIYEQYVIIGTFGWIVIAVSTGLIIYEIKRIKQEEKEKLRKE